MNKTKKITAALLSAAMLLLTACGNKENNSVTNNGSQAQQSSAASKETGTSSSKGGASSSAPGETSVPAGTSAPETSEGQTSEVQPVEVDLKNDDETLTIVIWNELMETVRPLVDLFKNETGYGGDIQLMGIGLSSQEAFELYGLYLHDDYDADLMVCSSQWLREFIDSDLGQTIPLSELGITASQYPNAYPYTLTMGTNSKGELTAVTWQASSGCFVYNAKLAEELFGVTSPEQMQELVKDWDSFKATAADVYAVTNGKTVMMPSLNSLYEIRAMAPSSSWVKNGKFSVEPAEDYLDMAKEFHDDHYAGNLIRWTPEWTSSISNGYAFGDFLPSWAMSGAYRDTLYAFAGGDTDYSAPENADTSLLSACEGPQGYICDGDLYICAAGKINTKKTAAEFLRFITQNEDAMKKYAESNPSILANNSKVMSQIKYSNPILIGGQNHLELLSDNAQKVDLNGKVTQYDYRLNNYFAFTSGNYISGSSSKEEVLNRLKEYVVGDLNLPIE